MRVIIMCPAIYISDIMIKESIQMAKAPSQPYSASYQKRVNQHNNNNNNGHFYGARSRAQCAGQKAAEKCINTYNGQNKKVLGHTTANHARIYIQQFQ